jgi:4-amino-4-deoxy-L-arabinose transferase-like glycosyltransferase
MENIFERTMGRESIVKNARDGFKDAAFWLLLILSVIYILGNIGTGSLTTWDEAVYANISANILRTGDWLVLHQGVTPWFDKPPLYMWCTAFFYNIFGINEFSTRLTSSLFGVATILLVYLFVKKMANQRAALLGALLLLAAPHYLHYAKMGMMDVTLTFFVTLMVYLFWVGQDKQVYLFWSGVALFFAYLVKGMAAISGPIVIILYCALSGNARALIKREFVAGILVSLLLITGWHAVQYMYCGPASINNYVGFHLFKRATQSLEGHTGGVNFYQKVIFNKNKPWGVLYYASLIYMLLLAFKYEASTRIATCCHCEEPKATKQSQGLAILLISWIVVVFTICTVVRTKLHWYIMPVYPALAMASGIFLERIFKNRAFQAVLAVTLSGMLLQVPLSWAFKLDYNPKAKASALVMKKLPYEDDGTTFYYETVNFRKQGAY